MFNILNARQPNVIAVVKLLLQSLSIRISNSTIRENLQSHPEYPSLFAISDCLKEWGISNQSYRIGKTDYNPNELEYPFIAHIKENGGMLMVIHAISNGKVVYSDENHKKTTFTEEEFLKKWSGVILHAVTNPESNKSDYLGNTVVSFFSDIKVPILAIAFILIFTLSIDFNSLNSAFIPMAILKLCGIIVSILLLIHSIDNSNPFIQNLCTGEKNNDCNAILKSEASKITKWLSLERSWLFLFRRIAIGTYFGTFNISVDCMA